MKKIKVLVLPSDKTGVGKFRSIDPHVCLQNNYPEEFHVDIDYEPKVNDYNYWREYDIVHFHRTIGHEYDNSANLIQRLNSIFMNQFNYFYEKMEFISNKLLNLKKFLFTF